MGQHPNDIEVIEKEKNNGTEKIYLLKEIITENFPNW